MKEHKIPHGKAQTSLRTARAVLSVLLLSSICYALILAPSSASPNSVALAAELPANQHSEVAITPRAANVPSTPAGTGAERQAQSRLPDDESIPSKGNAAKEGQSDDESVESGSTAHSDWSMPTPPPQYAPAHPALEETPPVDYSAIPAGYDCAGTRAVLEVARTNYPEITIVFAYPGSEDPLLENIWQHFVRFGYVAMTHEDYQDTRLFSCAPNCQFWNAAMLRDRGYTQGSVSRVMAHERVHNTQAANDPELAIHINIRGMYGTVTQQNWNYQALMEGHAELTGANVGPSSYDAFEAYYRQVQSWAEANGCISLFNAAVVGHWNAFLLLMELYEG